MMSSISISAFTTIMDRVKIIDIRSMENYNRNHIPGAINIPWENLLVHPEKYMNKNEVYYLYCQQGIRTKKICGLLSKMGYRVVHIIGGYEEWLLSQ